MKIITRSITAAIFMLCTLVMSMCDILSDNYDDCTTTYNVQFVSDMNLSFADAFDNEVDAVTLYVFDDQGTLVTTYVDRGTSLHPGSGKYSIDISELAPGHYHLVAWCGLDESNSFTVPDLQASRAMMEDLTCTLTRTSRAEGDDVVDTDLSPLFHGMTDIDIPDEDTPGTHTFSIQLTKDTNNVTVVLQQVGGTSTLDPDDYEFSIVADNGHLNYDNTLLHDEQPFTYLSWRKEETEISSIVAHLTTSRLIISDGSTYTRPMLTVTNRQSGQTVLSIPLIDYALMVRTHYKDVRSGEEIPEQEYLDRQSDYNMTFFLVNGEWLTTEIVINSWTIRLQDEIVR